MGQRDSPTVELNPLNDETAWRAVLARDRRHDGRFVTGVMSTAIYCRPSCGARHPRRENVRFFANGVAAREAGLRPCRRCAPDDVARDTAGVAAAIRLIEQAAAPPSLRELADVAGYAPHHFHRLFRRAMGITPAAYARGARAGRMAAELKESDSVTDAVYSAGYSGPSRFYAEAGDRLGMTPRAWRRGGSGVTIRWATVETTVGAMLLAATERGICRLSFFEGEAELRALFPQAEILADAGTLAPLLGAAVAAVESPAALPELPLDVRGTAFQEAVWRELARIPAGETLSYAALAVRAGKPGAARAAGSACGANPVAVLVPCHRVQRGDGSLGGYAYGLSIKQELLRRERNDGTR